jgi:hypothetical protein
MTISENRIKAAKSIRFEFLNGTNDYKVRRIGAYIVINDGSAGWVAAAKDYDQTVERVLLELLSGRFDEYLDADEISDAINETSYYAYQRVIDLLHDDDLMIYSTVSSYNDPQYLLAIADADHRNEIADELGIVDADWQDTETN